MATRTIFFTASAAPFILPADFSAPWSIEAVGGGGGARKNNTQGAPGGGGGAYSKDTDADATLTPGRAIYINVGAGGPGATSLANGGSGGDTWVNFTTNSAPASAAVSFSPSPTISTRWPFADKSAIRRSLSSGSAAAV